MKTKQAPKFEKSTVEQLLLIRERLNRKLARLTPDERKEFFRRKAEGRRLKS
jgi:DNA-directed RNA polymerase specialized sigma24 family protein